MSVSRPVRLQAVLEPLGMVVMTFADSQGAPAQLGQAKCDGFRSHVIIVQTSPDRRVETPVAGMIG